MSQVEAAQEYAGKYGTGDVSPSVRHLAFLDGLRGLAALYVVMQHSIQAAFFDWGIPRWLLFLSWGRAAVTVFIVISGFCLALPVLRSGHTLKGGALHFYKRRAFRILPPYYIALALGILSNVLVSPASHRWATFSDPLFSRALVVHLFLIHNWFPTVEYAFDVPLWSIAIECQIYVLFPLVVLFWRRFGTLWLVIVSFVFAHAIFLVTHHHGAANYVFEFVLGVWGAELASRKDMMRRLQLLFFVAFLIFLMLPNKDSAPCDVIVGVGAASLMAVCAGGNFWVRPLLSFGALTWFGGFSYSIYLVHSIVMVGYLNYAAAHGGTDAGFPAHGFPVYEMVLFAIVPLALIAAYVFHLAFEKPFMSVHQKRLSTPTLA